MIHVIVVQNLNQKHNPTKTTFSCQLSTLGRNILYIFLFHNLYAISKPVSNILDMEKCQRYNSMCSMLFQTLSLPKSDRQYISYPTLAYCEVSMHSIV